MDEATKAEIEREIDDMAPEGGWWHSSTPETLEKVAGNLVSFGCTVEQAVTAIGYVKGAIADEYGD